MNVLWYGFGLESGRTGALATWVSKISDRPPELTWEEGDDRLVRELSFELPKPGEDEYLSDDSRQGLSAALNA